MKTFGCDGNIYRTGKLLEKLPPQITETEAGPTRQFAPVPPGGIVTEPLPEVQTDWVDFYRNVDDVLNGRAESKDQDSGGPPSLVRDGGSMEVC